MWKCSLLKIWNMNKYTGVLGLYNCQGAAWSSTERKNIFHETQPNAITGMVRGRDVHLITEAAVDPSDWKGDCVVYRHQTGELISLPYNAALPVTLNVLEYDIFTVTPIKTLAPDVSFAPLGLINMFNAGGAIEGLTYQVQSGAQVENGPAHGEGAEARGDEVVGRVHMEVKGYGTFGAYSSTRPRKCRVESEEVEFGYDSGTGLVTFKLAQMPDERKGVHNIEIELGYITAKL